MGLLPRRSHTTNSRSDTPSCFASLTSLSLLAGFCYTQFADTYQEANGLLYADRTPKFPLERIARATAGGAVLDDPDANVGSHPHPPLTPDELVTADDTPEDDPH